ncbi:hypothetical protein U1Q18_022186 [Sarracenia purpurea var. burkii]
MTTEEIAETSRRARRSRNRSHFNIQIGIEKPNELSEELIKCLIGIFLKLNQASLGRKGSSIVPKHPLSCMNSKDFISKTTFNCKAPEFSFDKTSNIDPYGMLPHFDGPTRDVGPYKNFIQITRSSLDISRVSECCQAMAKLRDLIYKLCYVDLTSLTYKQKLAFWINIYNSCIMHAFLQHGLPSTEEKLLALMNKLRVYTPEGVVNELGRARVEYLEASVGITSKKKIVVPKLLQWHMKNFADDLESLLEWIYSQLPHSSPLKRLIMECLITETKSPLEKKVEIQHYDSEFRYLLPL